MKNLRWVLLALLTAAAAGAAALARPPEARSPRSPRAVPLPVREASPVESGLSHAEPIQPRSSAPIDSDGIHGWLLGLPDEEFRHLMDRSELKGWVARFVEQVSLSGMSPLTQEAVLDRFLTEINHRIRVLKGA